jgi:hypothetical protein
MHRNQSIGIRSTIVRDLFYIYKKGERAIKMTGVDHFINGSRYGSFKIWDTRSQPVPPRELGR